VPGDDRDHASGAGADTETDPGPDIDTGAGADGSDRREVVVPMRLYKTITVFATLIAVVGVIAGFFLLDAATQRASADLEEVNPLLAVLGLLAILGGGAVYAFSTRFRAEGMGKDKDEEGPPSDNE
jgi:hypothetical protein